MCMGYYPAISICFSVFWRLSFWARLLVNPRLKAADKNAWGLWTVASGNGETLVTRSDEQTLVGSSHRFCVLKGGISIAISFSRLELGVRR